MDMGEPGRNVPALPFCGQWVPQRISNRQRNMLPVRAGPKREGRQNGISPVTPFLHVLHSGGYGYGNPLFARFALSARFTLTAGEKPTLFSLAHSPTLYPPTHMDIYNSRSPLYFTGGGGILTHTPCENWVLHSDFSPPECKPCKKGGYRDIQDIKGKPCKKCKTCKKGV